VTSSKARHQTDVTKKFHFQLTLRKISTSCTWCVIVTWPRLIALLCLLFKSTDCNVCNHSSCVFCVCCLLCLHCVIPALWLPQTFIGFVCSVIYRSLLSLVSWPRPNDIEWNKNDRLSESLKLTFNLLTVKLVVRVA